MFRANSALHKISANPCVDDSVNTVEREVQVLEIRKPYFLRPLTQGNSHEIQEIPATEDRLISVICGLQVTWVPDTGKLEI